MRFPGFTDEWKTFSLGEKVIIKSGISPQCLCCDGNLPYYKVEQLNHCEKELGETPYYGQTSANNIIPKGSIIFPKRGAAIMTNKVRVNASECILDTNLMALIPDSTLYNHFLFYYVLNRELGKIADTSTIPQINNVHINPLKIAIPIQFEEQRKIGNFLSLLDERIATQNKIIEDLKKLKSAIIDNLLGRVQTDESDRMVKLGEIGKFTRGLTYSAEDIVEDGGIVVARANNLSNGEAVNLYNEIVRVDKPISDSQLLKYGDMVICMANGSSALVGKASYYNETTDSIATIGAFCGIYRSDKKIVRWLLQTNKYKRAIHKSLQGGNGAIANLTPNDILGLSFIIPKQEPSIVVLLQGFDEKLDIEISLLHSLQKEKQYLLSQMFI